MIVKIYGHAGQGIDLARRVIGDACLASGFFVQDMLFSGLERRGCDVYGYVKFDKKEIISKQKENPELSLVFDMKFEKQAISETAKNGTVIFNSSEQVKNPSIKSKKLKAFRVSADEISAKIMSKKVLPNMSMLGAFVKIFNKISAKSVKNAITSEIGENKEAALEFEEGYKNVKGC